MTPSELTRSLLQYLAESPTPFHAVDTATRSLQAAGFRQFDERERFELEAGTCGYVVRGGSSVIAFRVGIRPPSEAGYNVIGAHTDSPNLRLKPSPNLTRGGYRQFAVEVYGSALLSTWLDRDLSIAGRLIVRQTDGSHAARLIDLRRPMLRIPSLAIHLNRSVNSDGLVLNAQHHLAPIVGLDAVPIPADIAHVIGEAAVGHANPFAADDVLAFDLSLYDTQAPTVSGACGEFLHSARLDNLASCFAATTALVEAPHEHAATRVIALHDHEEVGSVSPQGADSSFLRDTLLRIAAARGDVSHDATLRAYARSTFISADMAHALHPNYADRHEPSHQPILGRGPVIKTNVNQAYATDAVTMAHFVDLCRGVDVTPQHFVARSDLGCGSTIGPLSAAQLGMRAVDIGSPMLSMHSIREMAATADVEQLQRVLNAFFQQ